MNYLARRDACYDAKHICRNLRVYVFFFFKGHAFLCTSCCVLLFPIQKCRGNVWFKRYLNFNFMKFTLRKMRNVQTQVFLCLSFICKVLNANVEVFFKSYLLILSSKCLNVLKNNDKLEKLKKITLKKEKILNHNIRLSESTSFSLT